MVEILEITIYVNNINKPMKLIKWMNPIIKKHKYILLTIFVIFLIVCMFCFYKTKIEHFTGDNNKFSKIESHN
jgi:TRAP-type C4-dicarboxylate transport system permease large subunit